MKFCTDIYDPCKSNLNDFGDPLPFPLLPHEVYIHGFKENILTSTKWISVTLVTVMHVPHRVVCNNSADLSPNS